MTVQTRSVRMKILGFCKATEDGLVSCGWQGISPETKVYGDTILDRLHQLERGLPKVLNAGVMELLTDYRGFGTKEERHEAERQQLLKSRCYPLLNPYLCNLPVQKRDGTKRVDTDGMWSVSSAVQNGIANYLYQSYETTIKRARKENTWEIDGTKKATKRPVLGGSLVTWSTSKPSPIYINASGVKLTCEDVLVPKGDNGNMRLSRTKAYLLRVNLFAKGDPLGPVILRVVGTGGSAWVTMDRIVTGSYAGTSVILGYNARKGRFANMAWSFDRLWGDVVAEEDSYVLVREVQVAPPKPPRTRPDKVTLYGERVLALDTIGEHVSGGLSPEKALEEATSACRHAGLKKGLTEALDRMRSGLTLSQALDFEVADLVSVPSEEPVGAVPSEEPVNTDDVEVGATDAEGVVTDDKQPIMKRFATKRVLGIIRKGEERGTLAQALSSAVEMVTRRRISKKTLDTHDSRVSLITHETLQPGPSRITGWWVKGGAFRVAYTNPCLPEAPSGRAPVRLDKVTREGVIVRGTEVMTIVGGIKTQLYAVISSGRSMPIEGDSVLERIRKYKSRRSALGEQKRYKKLEAEKRKWANYTDTRCKQNASRLARFAAANNVGCILVADYTGIEEAAERQAVEGDMSDAVRQMIRDWPRQKQNDLLCRSAEEYGIDVKYVPVHNIARVCPACGAPRIPTDEDKTAFTCSATDCGFEVHVDRAEAMNLLVAACANKVVDVAADFRHRCRFYGKGGAEAWKIQDMLPKYKEALAVLQARIDDVRAAKREKSKEARNVIGEVVRLNKEVVCLDNEEKDLKKRRRQVVREERGERA